MLSGYLCIVIDFYHTGNHQRRGREFMTSRIDAAILALCLLACAGAECVPLLLILTAAAGGLKILKEVTL